jgi:hypothetical protein
MFSLIIRDQRPSDIHNRMEKSIGCRYRYIHQLIVIQSVIKSIRVDVFGILRQVTEHHASNEDQADHNGRGA